MPTDKRTDYTLIERLPQGGPLWIGWYDAEEVVAGMSDNQLRQLLVDKPVIAWEVHQRNGDDLFKDPQLLYRPVTPSGLWWDTTRCHYDDTREGLRSLMYHFAKARRDAAQRTDK